jgi:NTE family protein
MNEALWRAKQIQYASRTAHHVDAVASKINLRHAVRLLKAAGAPEVAAVPDDPALTERRLDIIHIVYRPAEDQIPASDAEFSRTSIAARRAGRAASVKVVEIRSASEAVIGQVASGGIWAGSGSTAGAVSSAIASTCM